MMFKELMLSYSALTPVFGGPGEVVGSRASHYGDYDVTIRIFTHYVPCPDEGWYLSMSVSNGPMTVH